MKCSSILLQSRFTLHNLIQPFDRRLRLLRFDTLAVSLRVRLLRFDCFAVSGACNGYVQRYDASRGGEDGQEIPATSCYRAGNLFLFFRRFRFVARLRCSIKLFRGVPTFVPHGHVVLPFTCVFYFCLFRSWFCRDGWLGSIPVGVSVFRVYMVWCFDCFGELGRWDFVFPVLAGDPNLYVRM